jgi:redox-sensing transcriptional repressor
VPEGVDVRKVDLSIELQILAFHAQRRSTSRPESRSAGRARGANPKAVYGRSRPPVTAELAAKG